MLSDGQRASWEERGFFRVDGFASGVDCSAMLERVTELCRDPGRRMKVILIPALLAPLAGFLVSYAFPSKYTSQSLVLVEGQKVPEGIVQPVVTADLTERIATLQQQVLSQSRLQPMLERLGLAKPGQNVDDIIDKIRLSMTVEPVVTDLSQIGTTKPKPGQSSPVPGLLCELHRFQCARGTADLQRVDVASAGREFEVA